MYRCVRWTIAIALVLPAATASAQSTTKPNVVLIVTDDVGYGDIGSYGAPDITTPNIDGLAREGTRFTDFYAAPTCTPTRAALISGRYQQRVRLERPLGGSASADGNRGLPVTGRSLPQLLKDNGYATGLVGKWHLGYKPEYQPHAHGFEYFFGFLGGYIDYYQHTGGDGQHDLYENGAPVHVTGYMTDLITERSVKFIDDHASRPFFLEVAYNAAHWPFQVPDKPSTAPGNARFVQPSDADTSTRRDYAAIVERADRGIGEILDALHRRGVARNTLVIYTHDNGGEWLSRNAPLFQRKDTLWEGGIRVPLIAWWPGQLPAGRVSSQVGITMDLTASILAATSTPVPADARLDGIDLLQVVTGRTPTVERTVFFRIASNQRQQRSVRQGDWKLLVDGDDILLFDLKQDIGERNDLARERPDVARRLRPMIRAWEAEVDAEAKSADAR